MLVRTEEGDLLRPSAGQGATRYPRTIHERRDGRLRLVRVDTLSNAVH